MYAGSGTPTRELRYNTANQLTNEIYPDGVRTLYLYDLSGSMQTATGVVLSHTFPVPPNRVIFFRVRVVAP